MLTILLATGLVGLLGQVASDCGGTEEISGSCTSVTGSLTSDSAILDGTVTGGDSSGADDPGNPGTPDDPAATTDKCLGRVIVEDGQCAAAIPGALSLADVAAFRPQVGANLMQPNGWTVVGLDTNFYSTGGVRVVPGSLLGGPAEVRFTPVAFTWAYGDGASRRANTAGGAWASLGIREFDPTATSHVYRTKGTYTITLTIDYAVEYRLGSGAWIPIPGALRLDSNPLTVWAGSAKTVLVNEDCLTDPSGPGC